MNVFLHIGSHKTSTTAIQHFASRNREWLLENGLIYSSFDLVGEAAPRSHLSLVKQLAVKNTPPDVREKANLVLARANDLAVSKGKNILISAESLFRLHDEARKRVCDAMRAAFRDANLVVVAGLRSQAELSDSLYRNAYREYRARPESFETWLKGHAHLLDYEAVLNAFRDDLATDAEILLPYHKAGRATFVSDFFAALGVDIGEAPLPSVSMNTSLDPVDCIAKAELLGDAPDAEIGDAFNAYARENPIKSDFGFVTAKIDTDLQNAYQEANQRIIDRAPQMEPALSSNRALSTVRPMSDEALVFARQRAAAFQSQMAKKSGE